MPYLADTLPPAPIIVKGDIISPYIIAIIMLVIFVLFFVWVAWVTTTAAVQPGGSSSSGGKLLLACASGECGTNMLSGEKRCPVSENDIVLIDPGSEVCNPKFLCTSPQTPFALLANGSTSEIGVCNTGVTCRCLKNSQCATHVSSVFVATNGNAFNPSGDNRFVYSQVAVRDDPGVGNIQFTSPGSNFCGIKASSLNRLSPGACNFTDADYQNTSNTLKLATDCINTNPCVKGVMVLDPTNPAALEANGVGVDDVRNIPVTCVILAPSQDINGTPYASGKCPDGMVAYYDQRYNLTRCTKINYVIVPIIPF
jgi:hypothetical protein